MAFPLSTPTWAQTELGPVEVPAGTVVQLAIVKIIEGHWWGSEGLWSFVVDVGQENPIEVIANGHVGDDGSWGWTPLNAIELPSAS